MTIRPITKTLQFWVLLALLSGTVVLILWRGDTDVSPASVPLDQFPMQIGPWSGTDIPIQSAVLDMLGKGEFLSRSYIQTGPAGIQTGSASSAAEDPKTPSIGLFIGYFPTQRTGQSIHSPQNCLPGSGWSFESRGETTLQGLSGQSFTVGEYLISNGKTRDEVLYWYRSHGRTIASDWAAKWYTLIDSIRIRRTDAALVRVITPVPPGETQQEAHQRVVDFARRLNVLLPEYVPD